MKKMTRAFQLDPMPEPVELHYYPKTKLWYADNGYDNNAVFIKGVGYKKMTKTWKHETVAPLSNPFTAEELQAVAEKYGLNGAMAMVQGWGSGCLLNDNSFGLAYARYEVANMVTFGKAYDEFTDAVQEIGDVFIDGLLAKGFSLHGTREKGSLWYDYKNETECGQLVGFCGIYEKVKLHPLQYVEHSLGKLFVAFRVSPMFDPIGFDDMLMTLFYYKYHTKNGEKSRKMLDKYVSVKDRIKHLAGAKAAKAIESIFELQKKVDISCADDKLAVTNGG